LSKVIDNSTRNAQRLLLKEALPLDFPFSLQVSATHACNFKCYYCIQSEKNSGRAYPQLGKMMDFADFKTWIDNFSRCGIFKSVMFIGYGEPLTHLSIAEMVRYAKESGATERVEIITNASLLTPKMSDALIESGLDRLRISLQGLNAEEYHKNTGARINYLNLLDNISYFYNNRRNCRVIVKIFDSMIGTPEKQAELHRQYDSICDDIWVESISRINGLINADDGSFATDKFGNPKQEIAVCSFPFYTIVMDWNGDLYGCPQNVEPPLIGHANESFDKIWNRGKHLRLSLGLAERNGDIPKGCKACRYYIYHTYPSDIIDEAAVQIAGRIRERSVL
jgi:radical SAM protein with 4Fe4S-binding SPASM domain